MGEIVEAALEPLFRRLADENSLYLDQKGPRPARQHLENAKKGSVIWTDKDGNQHGLDFVFERGGTDQKIGQPAAFIEIAWRRYTKHSKAKAQEIQGAILPLRETYRHLSPFIGVVIAGFFTKLALKQLRSVGSCVLRFPFSTLHEAFQRVSIDASCTEKTPDKEFSKKVRAIKSLSKKERIRLQESLLELNKNEVADFIDQLASALKRRIVSIRVLPLHGTATEWGTLDEAITFIQSYDEGARSHPVIGYEITVAYSNEDRITARLSDRLHALQFLQNYRIPC